MGIRTHKDVFTAKWPTAVITDSADRIHFVPIKHTLGDYFFVYLNNNFYAFSLANARRCYYRETMARTICLIFYDTTNFKALDAARYKELELLLANESLPRLNMTALAALRALGRSEKRDYPYTESATKTLDRVKAGNDALGPRVSTPGNLVHLLDRMAEVIESNPELKNECEAVIQWVKDLNRNEIVTPVRRLSEFLQDDLMTVPASLLGEMLPRVQRADQYRDKITNSATTARGPWLKVMLLAVVIIGFGGAGYWAYEEGYFNFITDSFSGISDIDLDISIPNPGSLDLTGGECTEAALMDRWPEPAFLIEAVNNGTEVCPIPQGIQKLIDDAPDLPSIAIP